MKSYIEVEMAFERNRWDSSDWDLVDKGTNKTNKGTHCKWD